MNEVDDDVLISLRQASKGLLYPSESDEPFSAFVWNATEHDAVRQIAALGKRISPLSETTLDDFFAELMTGDDGDQLQQLRATLESRLSGTRVLRIGEVEVEIYVIGKNVAGDWAGVCTVSIET